VISGLVIANLSFFFGLLLFKKFLVRLGISKKSITWTLLFLLVFPTSFFFGSIYTEGLFFLLVIATLYFSFNSKLLLACICGYLTALTRVTGVFLVIPLVTTLVWSRIDYKKDRNLIVVIKAFFKKNYKVLPVIVSPVLGFSTFLLYLYLTTNNPFYFYSSLQAFNTGRTVGYVILLPQVYYRYIRIFLTSSFNFSYFIAVLEFTIFTFVLIFLLYDLWRLWKEEQSENRLLRSGLNIFSIISILLPTLTGTLTSIPRYALLSIPVYIRLGEIQNPLFKYSLILLFLTLHILLYCYFVQGYFIG
jgi:Gpi18-like mannosyltransferase